MSALNYDLIEAAPVILRPYEQMQFWIVGCGGTGSFLVQLIARIARSLIHAGKPTRIILVDPDQVEPANVTRQCFCEAEIGHNKAQTLAARYSLAWNLEIEAIPQAFQGHWVAGSYETLTVVLGCVDRAAGRRSLSESLHYNRYSSAPRIWWIDAGNGDRFGQVLIGSSLSTAPEDYQLTELGWLNLPAPSVQAPELLVSKPEEELDTHLSCADLTLLNAQGLLVNPQAAVLAAELALELTNGCLKRFALYFDQRSATMTSKYTTPAAIMRILQENRTSDRPPED